MRPIRRAIFLLLGSLALLALSAASAFFLWSVFHAGARLTQTGVTISQGAIYIWRVDPYRGWTPPPAGWNTRFESRLGAPVIELLPVVRIGESAGGGNNWYVRLPLWIPTVALLIWCALAWRRARFPRPGLCPRCGYDLAGLPSEQCPECGRTPTTERT